MLYYKSKKVKIAYIVCSQALNGKSSQLRL